MAALGLQEQDLKEKFLSALRPQEREALFEVINCFSETTSDTEKSAEKIKKSIESDGLYADKSTNSQLSENQASRQKLDNSVHIHQKSEKQFSDNTGKNTSTLCIKNQQNEPKSHEYKFYFLIINQSHIASYKFFTSEAATHFISFKILCKLMDKQLDS